jgi:hypothetical protein
MNGTKRFRAVLSKGNTKHGTAQVNQLNSRQKIANAHIERSRMSL